MKTLKKTLCLVLAMVMVFGLCAVSASAKLDSYTDKDDITYAEAVDVMTGIGVLAGDARGFRPTDTITRAEAAKIISYLLIGNATQADALKTTTDPFSDVPASHWAAGYIAYCAQRGIIAGMGDGYHPNDNVTGLQFAKMLLCAIGYGVNDEYTGADWAINVSKDALNEGVNLFKGNLAGANNNAATREECALYAFNALKVYKVSYSALLGGYITSSALNGNAANANEASTIKADFDLHEAETDADAFQRPGGHHWYVGKTTNIISADYGNPNDAYGDVDDLQASYTTGVTGADIYNLLGKTFIDGAKTAKAADKDVYGDVHLYVDGENKTAEIKTAGVPGDTGKEFKLDNFTKDNTETLTYTGNGVQTNVYAWSYKDDDNTTVNCLTITVVNTYMAKVVDVKAGTATKDPVTKVELLKNYTITSGVGSAADYGVVANLDTKGFNTDEFEEDDLVYITAAYSSGKYSIQSMTAAEATETAVSRFTTNSGKISIVAGGTTYVAAKNVATDEDKMTAANAITRTIVDGDKHLLYIDEYGYVVAVADLDTVSDYVYVAQFGYKADTSNSLSDKDNLVADIYYSDGTNKILTIDTTTTSVTVNGNPEDNLFKDKGISNSDAAAAMNKTYNELDVASGGIGLYQLVMKSGKAVLFKAADLTKTGNNVTKGITSIGSDKANNKTVFFYVKNEFNGAASQYDKDGYKVTAYVGINSVPVSKDKATSKSAIMDADDTDLVKAMLVTDTIEGSDSDTVYFYHGDFTRAYEDDWTVEFTMYVNGEETIVPLTYKTRDDAEAALDVTADKFYTIKDNEKNDFVELDTTVKKNKCYYIGSASATAMDDAMLTIGSAVDLGPTANKEWTSVTKLAYDGMAIINLSDNDDVTGAVANLKKIITHDATAGFNNVTGVTVALEIDDSASHVIKTLYVLDVTVSGD